jgi:hypothetical protein
MAEVIAEGINLYLKVMTLIGMFAGLLFLGLQLAIRKLEHREQDRSS